MLMTKYLERDLSKLKTKTLIAGDTTDIG